MRIFWIRTEPTVGVHSFKSPFVNYDLPFAQTALRVELSSEGSLYTMRRPHDLGDPCVRQNNFFEELSTGVVHLERGVVLRMPISGPKNIVEISLCAEFIYHRECCFIVLHT
jgi:hypothetical protein